MREGFRTELRKKLGYRVKDFKGIDIPEIENFISKEIQSQIQQRETEIIKMIKSKRKEIEQKSKAIPALVFWAIDDIIKEIEREKE